MPFPFLLLVLSLRLHTQTIIRWRLCICVCVCPSFFSFWRGWLFPTYALLMVAHIIIQVYHVTIEKKANEKVRRKNNESQDKRKIKRINCPSIENELEKKSNSRCCFRRRHINGTDQFYRQKKKKKKNGNANEIRMENNWRICAHTLCTWHSPSFRFTNRLHFWVWMESAEIYHTLEPKCQAMYI